MNKAEPVFKQLEPYIVKYAEKILTKLERSPEKVLEEGVLTPKQTMMLFQKSIGMTRLAIRHLHERGFLVRVGFGKYQPTDICFASTRDNIEDPILRRNAQKLYEVIASKAENKIFTTSVTKLFDQTRPLLKGRTSRPYAPNFNGGFYCRLTKSLLNMLVMAGKIQVRYTSSRANPLEIKVLSGIPSSKMEETEIPSATIPPRAALIKEIEIPSPELPPSAEEKSLAKEPNIDDIIIGAFLKQERKTQEMTKLANEMQKLAILEKEEKELWRKKAKEWEQKAKEWQQKNLEISETSQLEKLKKFFSKR